MDHWLIFIWFNFLLFIYVELIDLLFLTSLFLPPHAHTGLPGSHHRSVWFIDPARAGLCSVWKHWGHLWVQQVMQSWRHQQQTSSPLVVTVPVFMMTVSFWQRTASGSWPVWPRPCGHRQVFCHEGEESWPCLVEHLSHSVLHFEGSVWLSQIQSQSVILFGFKLLQ